jgi:RNA polymerase sigma-70 factor (ECF subfamily)
MEDEKIIDLYWQRNERAIDETDIKYGSLCSAIAYGILSNSQDTEECVNDTYMALWNSLPPQRPSFFRAYLSRITRNLSLNRLRNSHAKRRGGTELDLVFEELENCLGEDNQPEKSYEQKELSQAIDGFLEQLSKDDRIMFMYRYWMLQPVEKIARRMDCKVSRVNSSLYRSRQKLKAYLQKEGLI